MVLIERGASADAAKQAVKRAGGRVVKLNRAVGVATVRSTNADFVTDVARTKAVQGAARNRPVGEAPASRPSDPAALAEISGIGPSFVSKHATAVLALVASHSAAGLDSVA